MNEPPNGRQKSGEQIFDIDINDQQELLKDVAKCIHDFADRVEFQTRGQNPKLVGILRMVRDNVLWSHNTLESIKALFPSEPKEGA